ncbi:MAG: ribonuclease III [Pseudomonadota bacterium]
MMSDLKEFQNKIGYAFDDEHWLERALTHSSTNEDYNYQRLEFLGDRVLGLVIASRLFRDFRQEREGGLAKRHTALIQGHTCAMIGQAYGFQDYMILSQSEEEAGGRSNENIIADIVESVIGAIFVDGGYEKAEEIVLKLWGDNIHNLEEAPQDPKTELQEWVQARGLELPLYEIVNKDGPDHAPVFTIRLVVQGAEPIEADGPSRRQAEKTVASNMLKLLKKA